jgi:hypothetical protein
MPQGGEEERSETGGELYRYINTQISGPPMSMSRGTSRMLDLPYARNRARSWVHDISMTSVLVKFI